MNKEQLKLLEADLSQLQDEATNEEDKESISSIIELVQTIKANKT